MFTNPDTWLLHLRMAGCTEAPSKTQQNADASPGLEIALHASRAAHLFWGLTRNPMRHVQRSCGRVKSGMVLACCHMDDALLHVLPRHIHPEHNSHEGVADTGFSNTMMTGVAGHRSPHREVVNQQAL